MINVVFSSVSFFQPKELSGYIVQAQNVETGRWYYHPGPPNRTVFDYSEAEKFAKKVAMVGQINETLWWTDYPSSDFEAAERKGLLEKSHG